MSMQSISKCTMVTWIIAAIGALLVFLLAKGAIGWFVALIVGLAFGWFLRLALEQLFCTGSEDPSIDHNPQSRSIPKSAAKAGGAAAAGAAAAAAGAVTSAASKAKSGSAAGAGADTGSDAGASAKTAKKASGGASGKTAGKTAGKAAAKTAAKTSGSQTASKTASTKPAADKASTKKAAATKTTAKKSTAKKSTAKTAASGKAASEKSAAAKNAIPDYDGDGVLEGTAEGKRPETLTAARGGKADDLKQIKGIGPKLEKLCNDLGFYHFDQIASWSADEVAWVNANLQGFKGRVSRDDWVKQAKVLAAGGETEFSKRVEDGDVY